MTKLQNELKGWLASLIGKKLYKVVASIFFYKEKFYLDSPQFIMPIFEDSKKGRLYCCSDGHSICWDAVLLEPIDMQESGEEVIRDISYLTIWKTVIGKNLKITNSTLFLRNVIHNVIKGVYFLTKLQITIYLF